MRLVVKERGLSWLCLHVLVFFVALSSSEEGVVEVCDEATAPLNWFIFCHGRILEAVNLHSLFNDSKHFVDMTLKMDPKITLSHFVDQFGNATAAEIEREELRSFIDQHFLPPGSELSECVPVDWHSHPTKLLQIVDPSLQKWALTLHSRWKQLCRKISHSREELDSRSSMFWLKHEYIAPGGRFREFYYWDFYWIVKGLLASEMYTTVARMIENLADVIDRFGFVPNGGRIYYLQRSQPPMFAGMVYEYYECTHNKTFLLEMLPRIEKELRFWNEHRMVNATLERGVYSVYQYRSPSNVPRPESFREDTISAQHIASHDRRRFWTDIASAAETGWDFSSRWFADGRTLISIETTSILPVDLNALQCWTMDILEYLYERIGDRSQSEYYRNKRADFRDVIHQVFYNNSAGSWYDFNMRTGLHNTDMYPSMAVPLFTGCYHSLNQGKSERLFKLMQKLGVFDFPGGEPTSMMRDSSEQWDFPNGFSNLNHMIIEGLRKSENAQMQDQAFRIAEKWVLGNYKVFLETGHMWEKDGFGWTNGVLLDLLLTYNHRLRLPSSLRMAGRRKER